MSLSTITLTTNKSVSVVDDDRRRVRQSEKGLVLPVILLDADGSAYDLSDKTLIFSETKSGGKVVVDDGKGTESGVFTIVDAKSGRFNYTLQAQSYVDSGVCWFEVLTGDKVIDTTKNFYIDVSKDATIAPTNDSYVSRMVALEQTLDAATQRAIESIDKTNKQLTDSSTTAKNEALKQLNTAKQNAIDTLSQLQAKYTDYQNKYNALSDEWSKQRAAIQTNANNQIAEINTKANNQLTDYKTKLDKINNDWNTQSKSIQTSVDDTIAKVKSDWNNQSSSMQKSVNDEVAKVESDAINQRSQIDADYKKQLSTAIADVQKQRDTAIAQVNADREKAIKDANTAFDNKVNSLQTDYDKWKNEKIADLNKQLKDINDNIIADKNQMTSLNDQLLKTNDAVAKAKADFNSINFSDFVKHSEAYTKAEIDAKVAVAGKVKTVDGVQPNAQGDVIIDHYTKAQTDEKIGIKANQSDLIALQNKVTTNENALITKANASDVYTKAQTDDAIDKGGKVKTATINGGTKIQPTEDGNLPLVVPNPDLSPYAKTTDITAELNKKANSADVQTELAKKANNSDIEAKADKTDVTTLQNKVTAQQTEIDDLKKNNHPIVGITQAEYDALKTKDPNTIYAIGG